MTYIIGALLIIGAAQAAAMVALLIHGARHDRGCLGTRVRGAMLLLVLLPAGVEAAAPRQVLLIYSSSRDFAPADAVANLFRAELARQLKQPVAFHEIWLEAKRAGPPMDERFFHELLRLHYGAERPDLVVAFSLPAVRFYLRDRDNLFPEVPMLVTSIDKRRLEGVKLGPSDRVVSANIDIPRIARSILELLPETSTLAVVMGSSRTERFWLAELKDALAPLASRVRLVWLHDLTLEELRSRAAALPSGSAILYMLFNVDADGMPLENDRAFAALRAAASVPVFAMFDRQFGAGIVGGPLVELRTMGTLSGQLARRMLEGEAGADVPHLVLETQPPVFDWRELQRWGIPESRLPPGAEVRFRPPALWEQHKLLIMVVTGIVLLQAALIAALLFQRGRRRSAEKTLRESEARFRTMADTAPVMIWTSGTDKRCTFFNKGWLDFTGRTMEQELGDGWAEGVHPEDIERCLRVYVEAFDARRAFTMEYRLRRRDGEYGWILDCGVPRFANDGTFHGYIGSVFDLTERRRMELESTRQRDELAHLSRVTMLGELSGSLAHELNQPLASILSNAQAAQRVLGQGPGNVGELREILKDIVEDDRRAGEIIKRLRSFLRKDEVQHRLLDVNEVVLEVLKLMRSDLLNRNVAVSTELAKGLPQVTGDRVQLQQVLLNLFINGCDAMDGEPGDRRLTLRTAAAAGGEIEVSVADRGRGIRPEDLERVFEPFVSTKAEGLGLGLAVCRTIVAAHHGRLWAANNGDRGACFYFTLSAKSEQLHERSEADRLPG